MYKSVTKPRWNTCTVYGNCRSQPRQTWKIMTKRQKKQDMEMPETCLQVGQRRCPGQEYQLNRRSRRTPSINPSWLPQVQEESGNEVHEISLHINRRQTTEVHTRYTSMKTNVIQEHTPMKGINPRDTRSMILESLTLPRRDA